MKRVAQRIAKKKGIRGYYAWYRKNKWWFKYYDRAELTLILWYLDLKDFIKNKTKTT